MKKIRSFLFPVIIMLINCCIVHAQQVLSSTGASLQISSGSVSFTLGEPVIASLSATGGIITQGFHQTRLIVTAIEENFSNPMSVKVYPNPASDMMLVCIDPAPPGQVRLVLYELSGNIMSVITTDRQLTEVDLSDYMPGTYILKVYMEKINMCTYKIVKQK